MVPTKIWRSVCAVMHQRTIQAPCSCSTAPRVDRPPPTSTLDPGHPGVPGVGEDLDWFGWALAASDFGHRDGGGDYADLVIGAPFEKLGRAEGAGRVHVLYGTTQGLTTRHTQIWDEAKLRGRNRADASFGAHLSASNP